MDRTILFLFWIALLSENLRPSCASQTSVLARQRISCDSSQLRHGPQDSKPRTPSRNKPRDIKPKENKNKIVWLSIKHQQGSMTIKKLAIEIWVPFYQYGRYVITMKKLTTTISTSTKINKKFATVIADYCCEKELAIIIDNS